ncbi:hypothetical protein ABK040_014185 [Willaertia magna]
MSQSSSRHNVISVRGSDSNSVRLSSSNSSSSSKRKVQQLFNDNSNVIPNNYDLEEWINKLVIYRNENKEINEISLNLYKDLILIYQNLINKINTITIFNILLEEYPSLLKLLNFLFYFKKDILFFLKPILFLNFLILYKCLIESEHFNNKVNILNYCIDILNKCLNIENENLQNIIFEIIKTLQFDDFQFLLKNLTFEKKCQLSKDNFCDNEIISHINLCISILNYKIGDFNLQKEIKELITIFINNLSKFKINKNLLYLINILMKDESLITINDKYLIVKNYEYLFNEIFFKIINQFNLFPFKIIENDEDCRLIIYTIKKENINFIFVKNYLIELFKKYKNYKIIFISNEILNYKELDSLQNLNDFDFLLNDILTNDWLEHVTLYFVDFLNIILNIFILLKNSKQNEMHNKYLEYISNFIFDKIL